ncbi:GtrA family protein [Thermomonas carbonis]|uniref:GtrA family protein n=1 Tax=Thermomonas carbonis TaxID=1463158 RepID=A0A7G9SLJ0_9GAMM|nr:GtrA family protein [Thermomonas carbonis]
MQVTTRARIAEFCRYIATGLLGITLNVAIVVILTHYLNFHYLVSLALSSLIVTIVGFLLNRSWTFRQSGTAITPEFLRYVATTATQLAVGMIACSWLVTSMHMHYSLAVACVGVLSAPIIYLVHRGWSFGLSWLRDT